MSKQTLKIYEDSTNYTCQVIKLPTKIPVPKLDNLVEVNYQGNSVLVGKDSAEADVYLFFPSECQISHDFLHQNNLYRHETMNMDATQKGFFEDNRRVKAIKFKGVISSGFIIPASGLIKALMANGINNIDLSTGMEFNEISGYEVCRKFIRKKLGVPGMKNPRTGFLDGIIDKKAAPEHPDTAHLLKNTHKLDFDTPIVVSYKLHGTSARTYRTLVKRKLTWKDRLAKFFGVKVVTEDYDYVACSRRQVKSVGFEELPNKNHFFTDGDLWSEFAKKNLEGKLNKGESLYYEIVGKTYGGGDIQGGYSYGIDHPKAYVYRIANINPEGIEVDLGYEQMKERAEQLGLEVCPELFKGTVDQFLDRYDKYEDGTDSIETAFNRVFYNKLLEKPSILDNSVIEEGFCIRAENYPKPDIFKIKSKIFIKQESDWMDKETVNLEDEEAQTETNDSSGDLATEHN